MSTMTIKNARQAVGAGYAQIYLCPASTAAIVSLCQAVNVDGVNAADISVKWLDSSAANAETRIAHTISVPPDAAMGLLSGPLHLEAGDAIQAMASAAGKLELTLSITEFV